MGILLAERDRRALWLGALSLIGLVVISRGLPAWRRYAADTQASAVDISAEVTRARTAVRRLSDTQDSLQARTQRLRDVAELLLAADSPAAAAATMSAEVQRAADESGVHVEALRVAIDSAQAPRADVVLARVGATGSGPSPHQRASLVRVVAQTDLTADVEGLSALLAWLEENPPLLSVQELTVVPGGLSGNSPHELLHINLTVIGLARMAGPVTSPSQQAEGVSAR